MSKLLADYFTLDEAAAELGVTVRTLYHWRRDKKGPPVSRIGQRLWYYKPSLIAWLRSREEKVAA